MSLYSIMALYQAILLAVIQGFTEFLPISSSAHLALAPWLLGWKDQGLAFDIALHFGTLIAVLAYFFRDWLQILGAAIGQEWGYDPDLRENPNMLWWLAAGSWTLIEAFRLARKAELRLIWMQAGNPLAAGHGAKPREEAS